MRNWLVAFLVAVPTIAAAQTTSPPSLPETLTFRLYPDNLGGRRGHQLDIARISNTSGTVTARITMHGVGQDKCRIQSHPAEGSFDGTKLLLKAKVEAGDNITCPMVVELVRGTDGNFQGRYSNSQFAGDVKPQ